MIGWLEVSSGALCGFWQGKALLLLVALAARLARSSLVGEVAEDIDTRYATGRLESLGTLIGVGAEEAGAETIICELAAPPPPPEEDDDTRGEVAALDMLTQPPPPIAFRLGEPVATVICRPLLLPPPCRLANPSASACVISRSGGRPPP